MKQLDDFFTINYGDDRNRGGNVFCIHQNNYEVHFFRKVYYLKPVRKNFI